MNELLQQVESLHKKRAEITAAIEAQKEAVLGVEKELDAIAEKATAEGFTFVAAAIKAMAVKRPGRPRKEETDTSEHEQEVTVGQS